MSSIHENLKAARKARGMTQEEAAQHLGVTRQTVSSYEAGRTQPDLDMLRRLAEVYDTEINDLLYGDSREQRRWRRVRRTGIAALLSAGVCGLLSAIPLWVSNTWFWPGSGSAIADVFQSRILLGEIALWGESLDLFLNRLLCLLLLVFYAMLERPLPLKTKGKWLGLYALCALGSVGFWGMLDSRVALINYTVTAISCVIHAILAVLLSCVIDGLKKRRA